MPKSWASGECEGVRKNEWSTEREVAERERSGEQAESVRPWPLKPVVYCSV